MKYCIGCGIGMSNDSSARCSRCQDGQEQTYIEEITKLKQELKSLKDKQGKEEELIKSLEKLLRTTKNNWAYLQYSDDLYYVNTYKEVYYEGKNLTEALKKLESK